MKVLVLIFGLFLFLVACKDTAVQDKKGLEDKKDLNKDKVVEEIKEEKSIYDFKMTSLEGEEIDFAQFKNKKILIVNVASKCGYTPQYKDLQAVHEQYGDDLVILGFPANNFMKQEPGTDKDIAEFCEKNYGVTFQMFSKISVVGEDQAPLYQWLSDKNANGWNEQAPEWNFCKYLIDEEGKLAAYYPSAVNPEEIVLKFEEEEIEYY